MKQQANQSCQVPAPQSVQVTILYNAMMANQAKYQIGHMAWLMDNQDLARRFFDFADANRLKNVSVSARFIIERFRWLSGIREYKGREFAEYKISNGIIPTLAHSYNDSPGRKDFFITKETAKLTVPPGYTNISKLNFRN